MAIKASISHLFLDKKLPRHSLHASLYYEYIHTLEASAPLEPKNDVDWTMLHNNSSYSSYEKENEIILDSTKSFIEGNLSDDITTIFTSYI